MIAGNHLYVCKQLRAAVLQVSGIKETKPSRTAGQILLKNTSGWRLCNFTLGCGFS
jgi:hypothetical protein